MRLTSLEPVVPCLLTILWLAGCQPPPASEGEGGGGTDDGEVDESDDGDDSPQIVCKPGETRCQNLEVLELCKPTGLGWEALACEGYEQCDPSYKNTAGEVVPTCVGPCENLSSSSEGCSFYTTSMYQTAAPDINNLPEDAIIVGNPQLDNDATVELRWVPFGTNKEELAEGGGPVVIPPGGSHIFRLDPTLTIYGKHGSTIPLSMYRSGSVYHVVSNLPVVAYLHAPLDEQDTNASTLLLPENVLQGDYVIYNHGAFQEPNYFIVIAMQDQTTVTWRPSVETAGDWLPLPFVEAGESGTQLLNRFDNMRIDTSRKLERPACEQDLSGTVIEADKPIWVVSAVQGLRLPWCSHVQIPGCPEVVQANCAAGGDFAMEQNLPIAYWGREYVGPHSPTRGGEEHHWRIYAGEDNITINVTPAQPNTPIQLAKRGDWAELIVPESTNLEFKANGVFMPVQYVVGHYATTYVNPDGFKMGSPAMIQMVPTAQFLNRYVFVTGVGYPEHYAQVIRAAGSSDILLDGEPVTGWESVANWEIATVLVSEGSHEIHSVNPQDSFGILQYGYSPHVSGTENSAGYGYMGGMKAEVIYIP